MCSWGNFWITPKNSENINSRLFHSATFPSLLTCKASRSLVSNQWLRQWHLVWDRPLGFSLPRQDSIALHLFGNKIGKNEKSHWSHETARSTWHSDTQCLVLPMSMWDRPLGFPPARNQVSSTSGLPLRCQLLIGQRQKTHLAADWLRNRIHTTPLITCLIWSVKRVIMLKS